jgi:hypothetical protein
MSGFNLDELFAYDVRLAGAFMHGLHIPAQ